MKFNDKLKNLRKSKNLTQSQLAKRLNVEFRTVQSWEYGVSFPRQKKFDEIAEFFQVPVSYLLDSNTKDSPTLNVDEMVSKKIPVISWVSASRFNEASDPFPLGVADEYVNTTAKGVRMFALRVKNDCMEPEFREGEIITIDPDIQAENGSYVVVKVLKTNEVTFKQLKIYGNKIVLHPLNPKYSDIELESHKEYFIVGVVIEKTKKYR